jgi:hypothetical protein
MIAVMLVRGGITLRNRNSIGNPLTAGKDGMRRRNLIVLRSGQAKASAVYAAGKRNTIVSSLINEAAVRVPGLSIHGSNTKLTATVLLSTVSGEL